MAYEAVKFEINGPIARLTLNRPEAMNALNRRMTEEIIAACDEANYRDDIKALIITGEGPRAFSAGLDLKERAAEEVSIVKRRQARLAPKIVAHHQAVASIRKPVIAAVNGYAVGGGLEIALACDIRIASETATLQLPEVGRGLIPGWGGTQRLPRMVSPAKAAEMIFLGLPMSAEEAYRLGLVNKVVPLDQLLSTAKEWAGKICEKGPLAIRRAKEAMIRGRNMNLEDGLSLELAFFEEMLQSEDYQEGLRALVEKRNPEYKGH